MGGVALASLSELTFTWKAFNYAMLSSVASASRALLSKSTMENPVGKNMNAANFYGVLTAMATLILLPIALIKEGNVLIPTIRALVVSGQAQNYAIQSLLGGLFYYFYNEVAFICLNNVAPVTHALGNTLKRVVIILTTVFVFGNPMTTNSIIGSALAISGVLLYSLVK
jgi:solute carrier family 35 protein E1